MEAGFTALGAAEELNGGQAVVVADDVGDPVGLEGACFEAVPRGRVSYRRFWGQDKRYGERGLEEHETDDGKELGIGLKWQHCELSRTQST